MTGFYSQFCLGKKIPLLHLDMETRYMEIWKTTTIMTQEEVFILQALMCLTTKPLSVCSKMAAEHRVPIEVK